MDTDKTEACGRCAMSSVVSLSEDEDSEGHDPFDGPRIEVPESELRAVSRPQIWLGRLKRRLDEVATAVTYGRR
ncbi:hypothetical protein BRC82_09180 [Halobacteriales archaeon QS_1_67_19]|nr:MAG: hypothetical protein BRC82_09180 [Halobacteriales archaeon QS_1_67_19]